MCTAIAFSGKFPMLGRTLDVEGSFGEEIIVYRANSAPSKESNDKFILGVGIVRDGEPLFFDAVSSRGLAGAGLNLPYFTSYGRGSEGARNIASHSVIREVLSACDSVSEAREYFRDAVIIDETHSSGLNATPLHWIFADKDSSIVIESVGGVLTVYDNEWGALANAPTFDFHNLNIRKYAPLSRGSITSDGDFLTGSSYTRGLGALGLPGDLSSPSRFIRAGFFSWATLQETSRCGEISRLIHLLDNVAVPRGSVLTEEGRALETVYTVCYDLSEQICYFKTYNGHSLYAVSLSDYMDSALPLRIPISHKFSPHFITP